MKIQLTDTETKELLYFRNCFCTPQFSKLTEMTKKVAWEGIKAFWQLVKTKYNINIYEIEAVTESGELILKEPQK